LVIHDDFRVSNFHKGTEKNRKLPTITFSGVENKWILAPDDSINYRTNGLKNIVVCLLSWMYWIPKYVLWCIRTHKWFWVAQERCFQVTGSTAATAYFIKCLKGRGEIKLINHMIRIYIYIYISQFNFRDFIYTHQTFLALESCRSKHCTHQLNRS
jgi:hypothetical protein